MGFSYFEMEFSIRFPYSEMELPLNFHDYHFGLTEINLKNAEIIAELVRKLYGKFYLRIRKSSAKLHFKVRKPIVNNGKPFSKDS